MPPRPSLTAPSTGARATPDRAWKAAGTTGSTRSESMDSRGGTRQARHFHVSDSPMEDKYAPDASHFGSLGLVYVAPFLRAGMDRVRQSRRPFNLPLPESAEDHGDDLPVAPRGRPAGARLKRNAGPEPLLRDGGRLQPGPAATRRKSQEVPAWRRTVPGRTRRRRALEGRCARRDRLRVLAVHATGREADVVRLEQRRHGRRTSAAAHEHRRQVPYVCRDLHAREQALYHRGNRAGGVPGAGLVSAIARMARRERDRAPLSVHQRQRTDLHQWSAGTSARGPDDSTRSGSD